MFWLDEAEPEYTVYDFENYRYHLGPDVQVGNIYPVMYAKTFFDGQKKEEQEEIVNLIRCVFLGSQRFGTVLWSGDICADFASLRRQIKTGLHVAVSGIPWWTTDIGGFDGGDADSPEYRECMIRWFQFGTFCPVFRMHGFRYRADRPVVPPESMDSFCHSGGANEIWSYGEEAYTILRNYVEIRERLRPYIYENLRQASIDGTPLMRPLFYDFPEEERNYEIFDQYMFGPDIMVCPVCEAKVRKRSVHFPKGGLWIDTATGQEYEGGGDIVSDTPLSRIPIYLRKGTKLECRMFR